MILRHPLMRQISEASASMRRDYVPPAIRAMAPIVRSPKKAPGSFLPPHPPCERLSYEAQLQKRVNDILAEVDASRAAVRRARRINLTRTVTDPILSATDHIPTAMLVAGSILCAAWLLMAALPNPFGA